MSDKQSRDDDQVLFSLTFDEDTGRVMLDWWSPLAGEFFNELAEPLEPYRGISHYCG